jgi:hypothetical protein
VDLIKASSHSSETSDRAILSITDDTRTFSRIAVLADDKIDSLAAAIWHHWCQYYGNPEMILSNQGKVWTSKLESGSTVSRRGIKNTLPKRERAFQPRSATAMATKPTGHLGGRIRTTLELAMQPPRSSKIQIKT